MKKEISNDMQKIKEYFEEYIRHIHEKDNGMNSGALISYLHHMLHYEPEKVNVIDVIKMLVQHLDEVKINIKELVENNCTPPPIVIAPETEEGKALLRSIIEMQNKKT